MELQFLGQIKASASPLKAQEKTYSTSFVSVNILHDMAYLEVFFFEILEIIFEVMYSEHKSNRFDLELFRMFFSSFEKIFSIIFHRIVLSRVSIFIELLDYELFSVLKIVVL